MKSKHPIPGQVVRKFAEGDEIFNKGATGAEVARTVGSTETTWYSGIVLTVDESVGRQTSDGA